MSHAARATPESPMLNIIRKFLRPTLREQLEAGVREALRRYADRQTAPNLRVYVSEDLIPAGMDAALWARDETDHLRRFSLQWSEDNNIARAGLRLEVILLDTKREFAFVKPVGLEGRAAERPDAPLNAAGSGSAAQAGGGGGARSAAPAAAGPVATLEVVESPVQADTLRVVGEVTLGRKAEAGVHGVGDRYMSARHARVRVEGGRVWVTDLDSKNRTFVNDEPLPPHQAVSAGVGDTLRMGTTTYRIARVEG